MATPFGGGVSGGRGVRAVDIRTSKTTKEKEGAVMRNTPFTVGAVKGITIYNLLLRKLRLWSVYGVKNNVQVDVTSTGKK